MSRSIAPSRSWWAILTIALSALATSGPPAAAQDREAGAATSHEAQLTQRLDRLRLEMDAAEARRERLSDALVDLAADDAKLAEQVRSIGERIGGLERAVAAEERALEEVASRQAAIRQRLADERRTIAGILTALQRMGRRPPPALAEDGPLALVRGAIILNASLPSLQEEAEALALNLEETRRLEAVERDKWTRIRDDLTKLVTERARLNALREEIDRRRALSAHERDEAVAELARLSEEAASVEALATGLVTAAARDTSTAFDFAARRGRLGAPVAGRLLTPYGAPDGAGGLTSGHTIEALPRSTVLAPMPATVLFAAPFRSYGSVLILDAGEGYHMVLAGLDSLYVEAGARVGAGDPLGRMGGREPQGAGATGSPGPGVGGDEARDSGTGFASRPTLYVELRKDGSAIDSHGWWRDPEFASGRTSG